MAIKINQAGFSHARSLISEGKINFGEWEPPTGLTAEQKKPWCLAEDDSASEDTLDRWKYWFGKEGEVYAKAVSSAESYATKAGLTELAAECKKLYEEISAKQEKKSAKYLASSVALSGVPTEIQLIKPGTWKGYRNPEGEVQTMTVTEDDIHNMAKEFSENNQRDRVIDYEHQTLMSQQNGQPAPAAGWIKKVIDRGKDGLWAVVEWTAKAADAIRNKEYKYLSPVWAKNQVDKQTGEKIPAKLYNAALTNEPFFDGLKPLIATGMYRDAEIYFASDQQTPMEENMNEQLMAKLCKLLGIDPKSTPEQIDAAVDKAIGIKDDDEKSAPAKQEEAAAKADILAALKLDGKSGLVAVKAAVLNLVQKSGDSGTLAAKVTELETKIAKSEVDALIQKYQRDGKIVPATVDAMTAFALKDRQGFEAFMAAQPKVIVLEEVAKGRGPDNFIVDEVSAKVHGQLGVTSDMIKEYEKHAKEAVQS